MQSSTWILYCEINPNPSRVPLALTSTHPSVCNLGRAKSKNDIFIDDFWNHWMDHVMTEKNTHKNQTKSSEPVSYRHLHNDAVLFLTVCKLFVLTLFLWGAVMPCCSAHIFSTQSPLSLLTHLITILISATPHFVYPHCLRSTLSFHVWLFLKLQRFAFIVSSGL